MKESRLIIIGLFIISVALGIILYVFHIIYPDLIDYSNVATSLYCGVIVGLITSICQYCSSKTKIKNQIYGAYFDVYRIYYYSKNKSFLWHYDSKSVYKKIGDLNPKIAETLDEYHGFFRKYDKLYKKLNPTINLNNNYKAKNLIKSLAQPFNKKSFNDMYEPFMEEVKRILINIDKKRFKKDEEEMIKLYNYVWNVRTE